MHVSARHYRLLVYTGDEFAGTENDGFCMHICISSPAIWIVVSPVVHLQSLRQSAFYQLYISCAA